jgi:CRISPR-associated protein Cas6
MPIVDVSFPLQITSVPRDHGYVLYGAISRAVPTLHEARWLGVHPLSGALSTGDELVSNARTPLRMRLRLPAERIVEILPLAGSKIDLGGRPATIGAPTIHALAPAASLDARMVAIKLTEAPHRENREVGRSTLDVAAFQERYVSEIERQLAAIEVRKPFEIRGRRSLTVAGRRVVGFSVRVLDLNADESLRLMEHGVGGKRRMGCGVFRGTRGP